VSRPGDPREAAEEAGMADRGSGSITIEAQPGAVMAVIADFAAYPEWTGEVKRTEVLETGPDGRGRRVALSIDAGILRDEYELVYDWDGDRSVSWQLTRGQVQKSQQGSYELTGNADGTTTVRYELAVELTLPMPGILKRKAERRIITTALAELKRRVEALGDADPVPS
jgi:hypothetical protein